MIDSAILPPGLTLDQRPSSQTILPGGAATGHSRVLIVDDDATIRHPLVHDLRERGYDVHACESGSAALMLLERERFMVMLCDVRTPEMSGLDMVPRALELDPDLAVVMISGVNEAKPAVDALTQGAMEYLVKPFAFADLEAAVVRVTHRRQLAIERRNVERLVREEVMSRTMELEREKTAVHALTIGIAETLINVMEAKDVYLRGHSQRVAEQAATVAEELGLHADVVEDVRLAGRLHDIGKIGIREDILNKPGPLTADEFLHVQEHVRIGMDILRPLHHIREALEYVHDHHEHFDGSGYPRGKCGDDISLGGRILTICDAFDAMTSRRAYRDAFDEHRAIAHLQAEVGRLLDPKVFAALARVDVRRKTLTFIDDLHA